VDRKIAGVLGVLFFALQLCPVFCERVGARDPADEQSSIPLVKEENRLTPERLWSLGRVGEPRLSPDGRTVLFGVKWYDLAGNQGNEDLYVMEVDGSHRNRVTRTFASEANPRWRPDGKRIGFLYEGQIWEMDPDGSHRRRISRIPQGVAGFSYSPKMNKILFTSPVPAAKGAPELFAGLDKTKGRIVEDLAYRHWDTWVDAYSHIFVADYSPEGIANPVDIMEGEPWESPLAPFGGMEQMAWSPDGSTIAYTCRKKRGKEYALSTDSNIWLYDLATQATRNLTPDMPGYDVNPAFSPDGRKIAWLSMERDGYEADENRLLLLDLATGEKTFLSRGLDSDVADFVWAPDGSAIYFVTSRRGTAQIHSLRLEDGRIARLTDGPHTYSNPAVAGDRLLATRSSLSYPEEIHLVDARNGESRDVSRINASLMESLAMGEVRERWVKTTDDKEMLVWLVLPPAFDPARSYPALLYCIGGPEVPLDQSWSYRWSLQALAARGYVVVAPNRRGVPGFGREWKEAILGDWGGQPMRDLLSAIDDVGREPWVDEDRLAAVGPSFGGFSVYWLAGNHHKRFKAFVAHDGIFNLESMYLETEEMWFVQAEYGGPFWEREHPAVVEAYAASPHRFVQNWDTPILVIHSEKDYRVPLGQGLAAFNAAVLRGVPARFLYFPDENHWVLQPQNSVLWYRTVFDWLKRWLH